MWIVDVCWFECVKCVVIVESVINVLLIDICVLFGMVVFVLCGFVNVECIDFVFLCGK